MLSSRDGAVLGVVTRSAGFLVLVVVRLGVFPSCSCRNVVVWVLGVVGFGVSVTRFVSSVSLRCVGAQLSWVSNAGAGDGNAGFVAREVGRAGAGVRVGVWLVCPGAVRVREAMRGTSNTNMT